MADNYTPQAAPGIAGFSGETYGNSRELRLQDTPAVAYQVKTISNAGGADLELPLFSVVGPAGLAVRNGTTGENDGFGVLPAPVVVPAAGSIDVHVLVAGHFDHKALNWDASFTTDAQKLVAFNGAPAPTNIILGTNPFDSDGVLA